MTFRLRLCFIVAVVTYVVSIFQLVHHAIHLHRRCQRISNLHSRFITAVCNHVAIIVPWTQIREFLLNTSWTYALHIWLLEMQWHLDTSWLLFSVEMLLLNLETRYWKGKKRKEYCLKHLLHFSTVWLEKSEVFCLFQWWLKPVHRRWISQTCRQRWSLV